MANDQTPRILPLSAAEEARIRAGCSCGACDVRHRLRCDPAIDEWIAVMDARGLGEQARRGADLLRSLTPEERDAIYDDSEPMDLTPEMLAELEMGDYDAEEHDRIVAEADAEIARRAKRALEADDPQPCDRCAVLRRWGDAMRAASAQEPRTPGMRRREDPARAHLRKAMKAAYIEAERLAIRLSREADRG